MNNAESFLKQRDIYVGTLGNSPKLGYKPKHWDSKVYWVTEGNSTQALILCNHFMVDFAHVGFVREIYSNRMRLVKQGSEEHAEIIENVKRIRRIYAEQKKRDQERQSWIEQQNKYAADALEKAIRESKRSSIGNSAGSTGNRPERRNGRLLETSVDKLRLIRRRGSSRSRFPRRVEACAKKNNLFYARLISATYRKA